MTTLLLFAASAALTSLPYTYSGRLVDWNHQAYQADSDVTVRALDANGTVLAKTTTFAETSGSSVNYRLAIPIATVRMPGYALPGDRLTLQVLVGDKDYSAKIAEGYRTVGKSGEGSRLDLVLAHDTDGDGVPDEYADYYDFQMEGGYVASADSDGDGQSNYAEYVAGTSPIDAHDRFAVESVSAEPGEDGNCLAFTFVASAGRTYSLSEKRELVKPGEWTMLKFRTAPGGADTLRFSTGDNPEVKTIYVPVDPAKSSDFFRLNVE